MSEFQTGGATCALHPSTPAEAICDRCGGYMCLACSDGGQRRVCPTCQARTGTGPFPLRRDAWTIDALVGIAWRGFARNLGALVLGFLVFGGTLLVIFMPLEFYIVAHMRDPARELPLIGGAEVLALVVTCLLAPGFIDMALDAVDGRRVRFGSLFWSMGKIWKFLAFWLLWFVIVLVPGLIFELLVVVAIRLGAGGHAAGAVAAGLGGVLVLVALVWVQLPLYFAPFELALDDDCGVMEVLRRAYILGRGKRWATLGVGFVGYLVATIFGVVTCDVGLLFSIPLFAVLFAGLFLTFRNGSGLPPPARRGRRARDEFAPAAPGPIAARPVDPPMA